MTPAPAPSPIPSLLPGACAPSHARGQISWLAMLAGLPPAERVEAVRGLALRRVGSRLDTADQERRARAVLRSVLWQILTFDGMLEAVLQTGAVRELLFREVGLPPKARAGDVVGLRDGGYARLKAGRGGPRLVLLQPRKAPNGVAYSELSLADLHARRAGRWRGPLKDRHYAWRLWMLRLLVDADLLALTKEKLPPCPDDAPSSARKVYDGLETMLRLRPFMRAQRWKGTVFSKGWASEWCGVSERAAHDAINWLLMRGAAVCVGFDKKARRLDAGTLQPMSKPDLQVLYRQIRAEIRARRTMKRAIAAQRALVEPPVATPAEDPWVRHVAAKFDLEKRHRLERRAIWASLASWEEKSEALAVLEARYMEVEFKQTCDNFVADLRDTLWTLVHASLRELLKDTSREDLEHIDDLVSNLRRQLKRTDESGLRAGSYSYVGHVIEARFVVLCARTLKQFVWEIAPPISLADVRLRREALSKWESFRGGRIA